MADGTKPPKGALIAGLVMLALSLAACGAGGAGCASFVNDIASLASETGSSAFGSPVEFTATSGNGAIVMSTTSDLQCTGEDASGSPISFSAPPSGSSGSLDSGSETYNLEQFFETTEGTTYTVTCEGASSFSSDGRYLVVPFPGFGSLGLGAAGIGLGMVLAVLGLIFLIVGLVRRSSWKKRNAAPAAYAPQAGYAPPPGGGGYPPPPAAPGAVPSAPPPPAAPTPPSAPPPPAAPPPPSAPPPPAAPPPPQ